MGTVARHAGVGVGSLYRRYGSKDELLQHLCLLSMEQNASAADEALAAADAGEGLAGYIRACVGFSAGAFAPIAGQVTVSREMGRLSARVREQRERLVRRANLDGSLRGGVEAMDIAWLIESLSGGFVGVPANEQDNIRERLLAISIEGLRASDGPSLPGYPPLAEDYERRWYASARST